MTNRGGQPPLAIIPERSNTMKKALEFCKVFMWVTIGNFIGKFLYAFFYYKKHPEVLEFLSVNWYDELIVPLIYTVAIVVIMIVIRLILRKKMAAGEDE